jgi:hypothetical protein
MYIISGRFLLRVPDGLPSEVAVLTVEAAVHKAVTPDSMKVAIIPWA